MPELYSYQDSDEELETKCMLLGMAIVKQPSYKDDAWACTILSGQFYFFAVPEDYKLFHHATDKRVLMQQALDAFARGEKRYDQCQAAVTC